MALRDLFDSDSRTKDELRQEIALRDNQLAALTASEQSAKESSRLHKIELVALESKWQESQAEIYELKNQIQRYESLKSQFNLQMDRLKSEHRNEQAKLEAQLHQLRSEHRNEQSILEAKLQRYRAVGGAEEIAGIVALRSDFEELSKLRLEELESSAERESKLRSQLELANEEISALKAATDTQVNPTALNLASKESKEGDGLELINSSSNSWSAKDPELIAKSEMWDALRARGILTIELLDARLRAANAIEVKYRVASNSDVQRKEVKTVAELQRDLDSNRSQLLRERAERASDNRESRKRVTELTEDFDKKLSEQKTKIRELEELSNSRFITILAIDKENNDLKTKSISKVDHDRLLTEQKARLSGEINELKKTVQKLEQQIGELRSHSIELDAYEKMKAELNEKINHELRRSENLNDSTARLASEISHKKSAIMRLKAEHADQQKIFSQRLAHAVSSLTDPLVLQWLLAESSPQSARVPNGVFASVGDLPWSSSFLKQKLSQRDFASHDLLNESVNYVVVGRSGWKEKDLERKMERSNPKALRIYSQEMFVAKLVTSRDPFESGDEELLEAFARGHPALEFLMSLDQRWPFVSDDVGESSIEGDWSDFGVAESPLHGIGYHVGVTSKLSVYERRMCLRRCYHQAKLPFAQGSSLGYQKQWGEGGSSKRLLRMAQHLKQLADSQGRDERKAQARDDWISDLEWLRKEFYDKTKHKFKWP
jgi:hypothetical protein